MRIAHVTDLHLLEAEPAPRLRLRYLSFFRKEDAATRRDYALSAFRAAKVAGATHLVVTGDLTEEGTAAQFEVVADVLAESGWGDYHVTLLPGNHDRYDQPDAWARALDGPLRPWASGSVGVVERDGAVFVPLDSTIPQSWVSSAGALDLATLPAGETLRAAAAGRALVLASHHPPFRVRTHAVHGMRNHAALHAHLAAHEELHLLHGHIHKRVDRAVGGGRARVHSAAAVTVDAEALRLYDVDAGALLPVDNDVGAAAK